MLIVNLFDLTAVQPLVSNTPMLAHVSSTQLVTCNISRIGEFIDEWK